MKAKLRRKDGAAFFTMHLSLFTTWPKRTAGGSLTSTRHKGHQIGHQTAAAFICKWRSATVPERHGELRPCHQNVSNRRAINKCDMFGTLARIYIYNFFFFSASANAIGKDIRF